MVKLLGKDYSKEDFRRYCVNISQVAGITETVYQDGRARGMRALRVRNGSGLDYTLLPDRCMDIAQLSFRGVNIGLLTRNGLCAPQQTAPVPGEFDRYFSGGMLTTCGLKNCGPEETDEFGRFAHTHGRINTLPCEQSWHYSRFSGGDYVLCAHAVTRDTALEGYNLSLTREISTQMSENELKITDEIENCDYNDTDYLILYHFNFGFPFLSEDLQVRIPTGGRRPRPRNEDARRTLDVWDRFESPADNAAESVYFHSPEPDRDGTCTVRLENPGLKIGVAVSYETEHLPVLTQWRCTRSGEYALGIEPSNNEISGMQNERHEGRSMPIPAGSRHRFRLALRCYDL